VSDEYLALIEPVWNAYVREVVQKEAAEGGQSPDRTDGVTLWVPMSKTHPGNGPPAPGAFEDMLGKMDGVFRA
jgi:hypothetical protein